MNYQEALSNCIFKYLSGSHCYGTNIPESDEDYRGVFISPLDSAFDLFNSIRIEDGTKLENILFCLESNEYEKSKTLIKTLLENESGYLKFATGTVKNPECDEELQELRKFLKLASECNPNIIEFFYIEKGIVIEKPIWKKINENRNLFLSKKVGISYLKYALDQLKRIETHRGYLLNPKEKPLRKDFDLPEKTIIPLDFLRTILSLKAEWIQPNVRDTVINLILNTRT